MYEKITGSHLTQKMRNAYARIRVRKRGYRPFYKRGQPSAH